MRGLALCLGGLFLAALCGACGEDLAPVTPGLLQGRATPHFGGAGDQRSPALGHGLLAFVDYADDSTGGCENEDGDPDCAGLLRVVSLEDGAEVGRAEVADPRIAVGEGFVVWIDRTDARGYGSGRVFLLWLESGHVERLDQDDAWIERAAAPVVDGHRVAWAQRWPYGTVRILDLETRQHQDLVRQQLSGGVFFDLADEAVAWQTYDRSDWRPRIALQYLEESEPRLFDPAPEHSISGAPALAPGRVVYREQPWSCPGDDPVCGARLVIEDLRGAGRRRIERPGISRLGPVVIGEAEVFWLDSSEGPYALWGAPLTEGAPRRITPEGERLSVSEPIATDGDWVAWASFGEEDFDLHTGRLRPLP
ncbi:MAG: hypothetical protein P1V51_11220 [Deltaproteobacteria bacterium]|nr:hypothetical protein [Deltaproteobacteria bacterium]